MRRKTSVTIPGQRSEAPGERDNGKTFVLTEMSAVAADEWLTQYGYLTVRAVEEFPAVEEGSATSKVLQARVLKDPSLGAWRDCVRYQHAPNHPLQPINWDSEACQIEEVATINLLLAEVYELHTGFFTAGSDSTSDSPSATTTPVVSSSMQTSRRPSARLSPPGAPRS